MALSSGRSTRWRCTTAVTPAADIMGARQVLVITDFGGKDDENAGPSDESQEPENDDGADAGEEE